MGARKLALVVAGAALALVGFALALGGGALVWAHATQRDGTGYYTTPTERYATSSYAMTSAVDLGTRPSEHHWAPAHPAGTVRVRTSGVDGESLFVGIARTSDVDRWLAGVAHEHVRGVDFAPFRTDSFHVAGSRAPAPPAEQAFWVTSSSGTGTRVLYWPSRGGRWTLVVLRSDAGPGVVADVSVGARTGALLPIGIGVGVGGAALLAGGVALLLLGIRKRQDAPLLPAAPYPVRLDAHLDEGLSRWLWLVKWVLVLPHVVLLALLWLLVSIFTVVAGFAILVTGRYPRSLFDFNVGVMRWTWRVSFYAISAFGTDRYPPFSLEPDPTYPANFSVDYPERLSRGLVLVKWWLLAIPHYLILGLIAGGWGLGRNDGWRLVGGGGLISALAVVAAILLLVTATYPPQVFDVLMGLNRWCYRVLAYAALLRDEYPPFRLDVGGADPGSLLPLLEGPTPADGASSRAMPDGSAEGDA